MRNFNVMAVFCEDIRQERGDVVSLIGAMPDNVDLVGSVGNFGGTLIEGDAPRIMGKLCIYVRINFDPKFDIGVPELRLVMPDGEVVPVGTIADNIVKKAITDATTKNNILAGVISNVFMGGFRPPKMGSMKLEVVINGESYVAGALTFRMKEEKAATASSDSPQPS